MEVCLAQRPGKSVARVVARSIRLALEDRAAVEDTTDEREFFRRICIVFSVYEDLDLSHLAGVERVLSQMKKFQEAASGNATDGAAGSWERAMRFTREFYRINVIFLGKRELDETMPAVLLPIAALVARVAGVAKEPQ
jgi:hypothetical protein